MKWPKHKKCRNPTFGRVWRWHSHSRIRDFRVLQDSKNFRARLQGSKHLALRRSSYHWKAIKCRCRKWSRTSHLDICNTSNGKKKGRESNWQFESRPLKVGNWPDPSMCRWSATHHWKALKESYKFSSDLIPIGGLSKELWTHKVPRVQTETVSRTNSHSDVGAAE
jgi:hypothetical protein